MGCTPNSHSFKQRGTMGDSAYSFSLTTFSPSGKLVQIEYALNAVAQRPTALGIKATNGVVVAAEKKMPNTLIDETTVEKTATLTDNVGVVYSGLAPDFRVLVKKGRKKAQCISRCTRRTSPCPRLCVNSRRSCRSSHSQVACGHSGCHYLLPASMTRAHSSIRWTHQGLTGRGRHRPSARTI